MLLILNISFLKLAHDPRSKVLRVLKPNEKTMLTKQVRDEMAGGSGWANSGTMNQIASSGSEWIAEFQELGINTKPKSAEDQVEGKKPQVIIVEQFDTWCRPHFIRL